MYAAYPIYYPSCRYAREHDEIDLWRESYRINKECRNLINAEASPSFHDKQLPEFAAELVSSFGLERAMFVTAHFIAAADWDKRYDRAARERVARFDFPDRHETVKNRELHDTAIVLYSNVHPCILNSLFRILMEMEQKQIQIPSAEISEENEYEGAEI